METQTWFSCHNKFISAENFTILSVSSDDFLHAIFEVAEQQMWNYNSYVYDWRGEKMKRRILKFSGEGRGGQNSRCCLRTLTGYYEYIYANFIKHNRHFMPTYSLLDPFEFPYYFYRIRGELI